MRKPQDIQDLANFHILCHSWNNLRKTSIWQKLPIALLHKKWSFSLRISSINMTKSTVSCRFGHIYWRKTKWETSFFVNHILKKCHHLNFAYNLNLYEFDNACKEKTMIDSWSKSKLASLVIWFFRCGWFHDKTDTCKVMEVVCKFIYFEVIISTCISISKSFFCFFIFCWMCCWQVIKQNHSVIQFRCKNSCVCLPWCLMIKITH